VAEELITTVDSLLARCSWRNSTKDVFTTTAISQKGMALHSPMKSQHLTSSALNRPQQCLKKISVGRAN